MTDAVPTGAALPSPPSAGRPAGKSAGLGTAMLLVAVALVFGVSYDPLLGGAVAAGSAALALVVLAPFAAFVLMLFMLTGWPYYAGIPIGRGFPLPLAAPMVVLAFAVVLTRQLLGSDPFLPRARPSMHLVDAGVAALLAATALTILLAGVPPDSLKSFFRAVLMPAMLYWVCRFHIRDAWTTGISLDALLLGSAIAGCYAVVEFFLGYNPMMEAFAPTTGALALEAYQAVAGGGPGTIYRSFGFGMNPIFFGGSQAMMLCYAVVRVTTVPRRGARLGYAALGLCCLAGMLSALSRGPVLALGLGILLLAVAYRRLRLPVLLVVLLAAALTGYAAMRTGGAVAERVADYDNVTLRLKLWQIAWHMFLDNPLAGVGFSAFPERQLEVVRRHGIGPFYEFGGKLEELKTAEQGFLQFAAETGLLGLAAAGLLAATVLRFVLPALRGGQREPERGFVLFAGAGIVVFLAVGLTVTVYNSWEAACIVPVLLASLVNARSWLAAPPPALTTRPAPPSAPGPAAPAHRAAG